MVAADAEFGVRAMQVAGITCYIVRGRSSFTALRAQAPEYAGTGRPAAKGEVVRPLPRRRKGRVIPATAPDREQIWTVQTPQGPLSYVAYFWDGLVLTDAKFVDGKAEAPVFGAIVIYDPRYEQPLLLLTPQSERLSGPEALAAYLDRWPIELVPQAGKQLLGAARQFVFAPETCQRLPELALVAGALANYIAACEPAIPTGYWDRQPQGTAGRLRRLLGRFDLIDLASAVVSAGSAGSKGPLRKKASVSEHLPKGVAAHRRVQGEHLLPKKARKRTQQPAVSGP